METLVVLYASCLRESNSSDRNSAANMAGFAIAKWRSFRSAKTYLTDLAAGQRREDLEN